MFVGVRTVVGTTNGQDLFFRARVNPIAAINHVSELLAPPRELVTGYQRCNAPFDPRFYCSSRRATAVRECRVKGGDIVYLSQWIGKGLLPINKILDVDASAVLIEDMNEAESIFYTHLDTIFTRRVHETYSNDYKFSAAVTEQLTARFPPGEFEVAQDGAVGIRYPSVFDPEMSYNVAFPADFAPDRIDLIHITKLQINEVTTDGLAVKFLDAAIEFDNGKIQWTGNNRCLPMPRDQKGGVLFRFSGERWELAILDHLVEQIPPLDRYLNDLMQE